MKVVKKIVHGIESLSIWTGRITSWVMVLLMLLINFEVLMRYVFIKPTIWGYELSLMLGGSILIMLAYVQHRDANIRVEILYERVSPKWKALLNALGTVIFAYPCFIYLIIVAFKYMVNSFVMNEKMAESYWYPPAAPFRTIIFLALCLAALQFTVSLIGNLYMLIKGEQL